MTLASRHIDGVNPDGETALAPDRFVKRLAFVSKAADMHPERLLKWIAAWAGLSATWSLMGGQQAEAPLSIGALALAKLHHGGIDAYVLSTHSLLNTLTLFLL